jgi:predicted RNA-binding protein with PIN domain
VTSDESRTQGEPVTDATERQDPAEPEVAGLDVVGLDVVGLDVTGPDMAGPEMAGPEMAGPEMAGPDARGAEDGPTGQAASGDRVATLPPRVRRALVEFAADVLGALNDVEVPIGLRKIRNFAPARRARAGSAPLALALERDAGFRLQVARAWRALNPELAAMLDADEVAPALDPVHAAVGTYLCRPEGWTLQLGRRLVVLAEDEQAGGRREQSEADRDGAEALRAALSRARDEAVAAAAARDELEAELSKLRREQRRLRADADRARSATREAERRAAEEQERLNQALAERDELVRLAERQTQEAQEQLAAARRSARDGKSLAEVRTRLLLDTIVDSAAALRRELALPPTAQTPAELVAEQLITPEQAVTVATRGRAGDDPEFLAEVLRLPRAHLLVDGYNVTMEGFGALPLIDQRRLLVDALSTLVTRTSAEITCCFDGAEVEGRTQGLIRGVRVLFSDPGTTADDLIGRLVRAEPEGRVVVVVSSDGEVMAAAVAAGARSFRSTVLLRLLGAGSKDRRR